MMQMINVVIDSCLNQQERLTPCELEFIRSLDEHIMMPNENQINRLKSIWDGLKKQ